MESRGAQPKRSRSPTAHSCDSHICFNSAAHCHSCLTNMWSIQADNRVIMIDWIFFSFFFPTWMTEMITCSQRRHGNMNVVIMVVRAFQQLLVFLPHHSPCWGSQRTRSYLEEIPSERLCLDPLGSVVRVGRLAGGHRKATGSQLFTDYSHFLMRPIEWSRWIFFILLPS